MLLTLLSLLLVVNFWRIDAAPTDIPSAASFYVPSLPDVHQDPSHPLKIFAGHISSDPHQSTAADTDTTAHLYFVLIKNRRHADKERVMFWFNGGPGCSSFDGLMMEVGPWRMVEGGGFEVAEGGWEEYTTMIYVDQPAGTGFSYTSTNHYVHTLEQASEQFLIFLQNFYKVFPEYEHVDTYLGGESYAGQYIPYFANAILDSSKVTTPLRGVAIGNGWIDGRNQYPSYVDYAVKHGLLEENSDTWKNAKTKTDECMKMLEDTAKQYNVEPISIPGCDGLMMDVMVDVSKERGRIVDGKEMCVNIYDVRYDDEMPACGMNWPKEIKPVTDYLDRSDVVRALHASEHSSAWVECRGRIHQELHENKSNSSVTLLPRVLERIPVLLFAGDQDLICNYLGQEAMIARLSWAGETGLGTVQTQSWTVDGVAAGTWVESRNLTYAKIFNASHMAPYDVPHIAHDMILRFMGMNFSAIVDGSARIPSSIGSNTKPTFLENDGNETKNEPVSGKTPEQDKAMWEAYYNAGSAALVLVIVFIAIVGFLWCRRRKNRSVRLPVNQRDDDAGGVEERIPLNPSSMDSRMRKGKGKERAVDDDEPPIFDVGEGSGSEDEEREEGRERYKDSR